MNHLSALRSTGRARWLAELSATLDDAQILLARLVAERIDQGDADHLRMRIEELRSELRALHQRGFFASRLIDPPRQLHPDWQPQRD
jgi:hypothetical protein